MTDTPAMNVQAILIGLLSVTHTPEQAEHAAKTVLGLHAHQLAEQIRAEADKPRKLTESAMGRSLRHSRYRQAADLIDPKATR